MDLKNKLSAVLFNFANFNIRSLKIAIELIYGIFVLEIVENILLLFFCYVNKHSNIL